MKHTKRKASRLLLATAIAGSNMLLPGQLSAQYADGTGTGSLQKEIFWLSWGQSVSPQITSAGIVNGTYTWMIGNDIKVEAVITNLDNDGDKLVPYNSGDYGKDGLGKGSANGGAGNILYPGANPIGMSNGSGSKTISMDIEFKLFIKKGNIWQSVDYPGIVVGDAESLATGSNDESAASTEFIAAETNGPLRWQLLDFRSSGNATTDLEYLLQITGNRFKFRMSDASAGNISAQSVSYAHGATKLTNLTLKGGGITSMAVGFVVPFDFGDAPASYGNAGNYINDFAVADFASGNGSYQVATVTPAKLIPMAKLWIGPVNDVDADGNPANSLEADADGGDESGAIFPTTIKVNQDNDVEVKFVASNTEAQPATVYCWVDFDGDGRFSVGEAQTVVVPAGANLQSFTITFPQSQFGQSVKGGKTYVRLRITTDNLSDDALTTAVDERSIQTAVDGETEDYVYEIEGISIKGNVYNDVNGVSDNQLNGTLIQSISDQPLYAYLADPLTGNIVDKVAVSATGTYAFNVNKGAYRIAIASKNVAVGTLLNDVQTNQFESGWVSVGEQYGINNIAGTGLKSGVFNSVIDVQTPEESKDITNVNFAIEQKPSASSAAVPAQPNPGGQVLVSVPPATFVIADPAPGKVTSIFIEQFPANATSIRIGDYVYNAGNWPGGGMTIFTDDEGNLSDTIAVDPVDGITTVAINYIALDSAGQKSNPATASLPFTAPLADLLLFKTVNESSPMVGDTVTFTLSVRNAGPSLATGVAVKDLLPTGYQFIEAIPSSDYNALTGLWELADTLAKGDTLSLQMKVRVNPSGVYLNKAEVAAANENDPNSTPDNNNPAENDQDEATTTPIPVANLGIIKDGPETVVEGQQFSYTLSVYNAGPSEAVNALVMDAAVAQFTAGTIQCSATGSSVCPQSNTVAALQNGLLTIPSLKVGDTVTFTLTGVAGASAEMIENIASISPAAGTIDPSPGNNTDTAITYINPSVSGNVFNDVDGLNGTLPNTINGVGTDANSTLYVHMVDKDNVVVATEKVNADGTYRFPSVTPGSYTVVLNSSASPSTLSTLTGTWLYIGEHLGTAPGTDGTADGRLAITVGGGNVDNANFGVEQPPVATADTAVERVNPGGDISMPVPPATFVVADPAPGKVTGILITELPENAQSITIDGILYDEANPLPSEGILVPVHPQTGQPAQDILVDPTDGATVVQISYSAVDEAGKTSPPATASVPFTSIILSGQVFNDANGLAGSPSNTVDGTGTYAGGLKAILYHTGTGIVDAVADVAADGSFVFENRNAGTYSVLLTTASIKPGDLAPAVILPYGWLSAGEFLGAGAGSDGNPNSTLSIGTVDTDVDNIKFGINRHPEAFDVPAVYHKNPGGNNTVPVGRLGGADPDDGPKGEGDTFIITTVPTNATLYYDGEPVKAGDTLFNYDPALLRIDPEDGEINAIFTYTVMDAAGHVDPTPATVRTYFIPHILKGTVFNDANGLSDNLVNGTGEGQPSDEPLYANLVDPVADTVIASVPVLPDGSYLFPSVQPDRDLWVQISVHEGIPGSSAPATQLPDTWVFTGERLGTGAGHDGQVDGWVKVFSDLDTTMYHIDFGINRIPVAHDKQLNLPSIAIDKPYPLTEKPLSGTDPEEGNYGAGKGTFVLGEQPSCCAIVSYEGVVLEPGQIIPEYEPSLLTITFTDILATTASFTYQVVDSSGTISTPATYTINTATVLPVKWHSFTVKRENNASRLEWTTLEERNNYGFSIERSADARHFTEIDFVSSQATNGESNAALVYTAYDKQPLQGWNYYRLKQSDKDGSVIYSEVREILWAVNGRFAVEIYPNPVVHLLQVRVTDWSQVKELRLLDIQGRAVYQTNSPATEVNMSSLTPGTYLLWVEQHNGSVNSFKVVKE